MIPSWSSSPDTRISFTEIVNILESLMDVEETLEYQKLTKDSDQMARLLMDHTLACKRSSFTRENSLRSNAGAPKGASYSRVQSAKSAPAAPVTAIPEVVPTVANGDCDGYTSFQEVVQESDPDGYTSFEKAANSSNVGYSSFRAAANDGNGTAAAAAAAESEMVVASPVSSNGGYTSFQSIGLSNRVAPMMKGGGETSPVVQVKNAINVNPVYVTVESAKNMDSSSDCERSNLVNGKKAAVDTIKSC